MSRTDFIVSMAEATKTCPHGQFCCLWSRWVSSCQRQRQQNPAFAVRSAAFAPGEFHRVNGGSSKILLLRRDCCLWSWRASSGLRQKQQNPVSMVCSAAFALMGFIVSMAAEAAKTCIPRHVCCLWSRWVSSCRRRRQLKTCS